MSISQKQCPHCGAVFDSEIAFSAHRVGRMSARRCLSAAEMTEAGLAQKDGGVWFKAHRKIAPNAAAPSI